MVVEGEGEGVLLALLLLGIGVPAAGVPLVAAAGSDLAGSLPLAALAAGAEPEAAGVAAGFWDPDAAERRVLV